jgi:hypothetical protein
MNCIAWLFYHILPNSYVSWLEGITHTPGAKRERKGAVTSSQSGDGAWNIATELADLAAQLESSLAGECLSELVQKWTI